MAFIANNHSFNNYVITAYVGIMKDDDSSFNNTQSVINYGAIMGSSLKTITTTVMSETTDYDENSSQSQSTILLTT